MTLLNLRIERLRLAIANSLDEVGEVVSLSFGGGTCLFLAAEKGPIGTVVGDLDISLRPEKENANGVGVALVHANVAFRVSDPVADFKGKQLLLFRIFERANLCVGSLLVIIKHVMSAHGLNFRRESNAQPPAGYIKLVNALIP